MPAAPALSLLFSSPLTSLSLSQDERLLVVGGLDVFSLIRFAEPGGAPAAPPQDMQTQYKRITDVCLNRVNEHLLACGTTRGGVDVFDLVNGTRVETLPASGRPHASAVNKLAWNPSDPNTLVTASSDATLSILDVRLREPVQCTLSPKSRDVRDVAFSPHELYSLAACFSNGTVKLFDYRHPKRCLHDVLAHDGMAMCLAYHPTRRGVLASGGSSAREGAYNLKILAPEKDTQRATLQVLRTFGGVSNVAWRPSFDSQLAAAVDNSVMVWDVDEWTCAPLAQFEGHGAPVSRFSWLGQGTKMVSCGKDGLVLGQDVYADAARPIEAKRGNKLSFAPDGLLVTTNDPVPKGYAGLALKAAALPNCHRAHEKKNGRQPRLTLQASVLSVEPADAGPRLFKRLAKAYHHLDALAARGDLAAACNAFAQECHALGAHEAHGFWLTLGVLLSPAAALEADSKTRELGLLRKMDAGGEQVVVLDGTFLSAASIRLLRALQNIDPLDAGFQVRPRGPLRVAMQELDGALLKSRSDDWIPLHPAKTGPDQDAYSAEQRLNTVAVALEEMADKGHLQTCVTAALLMTRAGLPCPVKRSRLLSWVECYVEALRRFAMFPEAKDMIILYGGLDGGPVKADGSSKLVAPGCAVCGEPQRVNARTGLCEGCGAQVSRCALCRQVVRGEYVWCAGCGHGGHFGHYATWFAGKAAAGQKRCPVVGCGHICSM